MNIQGLLDQLNNVLINWPLFIYVIGISILCTVVFGFIQIRYLVYACKQVLFPSKAEKTSGDMTPVQAFMNALSASLGNGAIAGVAVAIHFGGPGAVLWILIFGFLLAAVRFAEAYLSMYFTVDLATNSSKLGGPMIYLRQVTGGKALAYVYAVLCFFFGLIGGNSIQANSIQLSLNTTFGLAPIVSAFLLFAFILYILFGGAARIVKVSDQIVPVKVILFFSATLILLAYHYQSLGSALMLICQSAFSPLALAGGVLGFTVQQAFRYGMTSATFATEAGLGTAGILFGSTGSKEPVKDAMIAMLSTLISAFVCFVMGLSIVVSGVWNSGLSSTPLTIAAFQTVFGSFGAYLVTFLSVTFGIGVIVSYAYITREVWLFLTKGKFVGVFSALYCLFAFGGALLEVKVVWGLADTFMATMLLINLFGIVYLLPVIRKGLAAFEQQHN